MIEKLNLNNKEKKTLEIIEDKNKIINESISNNIDTNTPKISSNLTTNNLSNTNESISFQIK
jgi:hypothetical protein